MTNRTLTKKLIALKAGASPLEIAVIDWLLDCEDIKDSLNDLMNHGCVSGMVSELIYYKDTLPFFQKHSEEILEMWEEMGEELGEQIKINSSPSYNWFAWFGFEETARKVAEKLGIEL